jgi:hypothetical protein
MKQVHKDITIKIEEPIGYDIDIKDEFGVGRDEEEDCEKNSCDSDYHDTTK